MGARISARPPPRATSRATAARASPVSVCSAAWTFCPRAAGRATQSKPFHSASASASIVAHVAQASIAPSPSISRGRDPSNERMSKALGSSESTFAAPPVESAQESAEASAGDGAKDPSWRCSRTSRSSRARPAQPGAARVAPPSKCSWARKRSSWSTKGRSVPPTGKATAPFLACSSKNSGGAIWRCARAASTREVPSTRSSMSTSPPLPGRDFLDVTSRAALRSRRSMLPLGALAEESHEGGPPPRLAAPLTARPLEVLEGTRPVGRRSRRDTLLLRPKSLRAELA
mmetsp:Transcript_66288/g.209551  ORF Transcript_66288/g.209551 Transcript_66288/m.209551 type:complete len:288 (-) Transcript_66288:2474-3337(-)